MSDSPTDTKLTSPAPSGSAPPGSTTTDNNEVFLPDAVRRASRRAAELMQQQVQQGVESLPEALSEEAPSPTAPQAPLPMAPAPPEQDVREVPADDAYEQRYRTLQGKYDAETAGLRAQIAGLERLMATLQSAPTTRSEEPPASHRPVPAERVEFSQEDKDLYGEDLLEVMARTAEARYQPLIHRLEQQIQQLQGTQNNQAAVTLQDRLFAQLDADPELGGRDRWWAINTSHAFKDWLNQIDEYSGVSRFQMLQHAYQSGDAMRTGRFFKKYMAEHTVPVPSAASTQTRSPAPVPNGHAPGSAGSPRLEDFAAPGRAAGNGQAGNGAPPRIWSKRDIQAFYRDRTHGRFRGREAEADRLETDIFAADREGRIQ